MTPVGTAGVVVVGSLNMDLTLALGSVPAPGETVLATSTAAGGGGKGGNQAVACARLGRRTAMVGALGRDGDGDMLRALLTAEGVDTSAVSILEEPTGRAVVLLTDGGESTIIVAPGANAGLTAGHVVAHADLVAGAGCVLLQQEVATEVNLAAAELARGRVILNPAPARAVPPALVARADVLVPNAGELVAIVGATAPADGAPADRDVLARMARTLLGPEPGARSVIVTMGGRGCLVVTGSAGWAIPARDVEVLDSTAAGDSFCAGLADALLRGADFVEAAHWATDVAAVTVTRAGAMASLPSASEVRPTRINT